MLLRRLVPALAGAVLATAIGTATGAETGTSTVPGGAPVIPLPSITATPVTEPAPTPPGTTATTPAETTPAERTPAETTPAETTPSEPGPAPFPSLLTAAGRTFFDEHGVELPVLRGFNVHVAATKADRGFVWPQSHFDAMRAVGAGVNRAVLHWDVFEPAPGVIDTTAVAALDTHIARAQAAGMYTILELHLNVNRRPSWMGSGIATTADYTTHGRFVTEFLAARYGRPLSPQYTKAVIGFQLNEPPPRVWSDRTIPDLEDAQRTMITWMRGPAPRWIAGVALGYAQQSPYLTGSRRSADASAYDSVGANVFIDQHVYAVQSKSDGADDSRQPNGMIWPEQQGGPGRFYGWGRDYAYPGTALSRAQLISHIAPYARYADALQAPLVVGEWGIENKPQAQQTAPAYVDDLTARFRAADVAMEIWWDYSLTSGLAARPNGEWQPAVLDWMSRPRDYPRTGWFAVK